MITITALVLASLAWLAPPTRTSELDVERERVRVEGGLELGTDVWARGSPNQSHYAPQTRLRFAFGLPRIGLLARVGVGGLVSPARSIAERNRGVIVEQALGLRTMPVQRKWLRFGLWVVASYERVARRSRLDVPLADDPAQVETYEQRWRVDQLAPELGFEWAIPLPVPALREHDMTLAFTLTHAFAFVFPLALRRELVDGEGTTSVTHHHPRELGVVGPAGGVVIDLYLGVTLAFEGPWTRRPGTHSQGSGSASAGSHAASSHARSQTTAR
jgi:hypothetical protein